MRQAENKVFIEGVISEIDIEESSYSKNGKDVEVIRGTIKVRVDQEINKEMKSLEIPVSVFAPKITSKNALNPAYTSLQTVMKEYKSIAAVGIDDADRVRISGASIRMNGYWATSDKYVSYPRINASFINRVGKNECVPKATFTAELVVSNVVDEMDRDGNPTGNMIVNAILMQYGGKAERVPFIAKNPAVIDAVSSYWQPGDTVKATGKLNFSSTTTKIVEEQGFGEPIEKTRTVSVSELVITGGSQSPLEGEFAFDPAEVRVAVQQMEEAKEADRQKKIQKDNHSAPKATNSFDNLGF